jgi:flavin-binding protein dodecin
VAAAALSSDAPAPQLCHPSLTTPSEERTMAESVYKVIELVGTSSESWEKAAGAAIKRASKTLRDLRIAEVKQLDMVITDGKVEAYRAKLSVSFKYEGK